MKNLVVIGGGTGSYVTLMGLKKFADELNISAIVTVADSGGSAKQERDEFGLLPVSDMRKALIALAKDSGDRRQEILRQLFSYRFVDGQAGIRGGTFGNLFIVALSNILGSETEAIEEVEMMLQTQGRVLPVSLKTSNLVMEYQNGQVIVGEHYLDDFPGDGTQEVVNCYLLPPITANEQALHAIKEADVIVIPPGDLYASIVVNFVVDGMKEALRESKAKIIYMVNLMTKYGQTYNLPTSKHVQTIEEYIGREIDKIVINSTLLPKRILSAYEAEKDFPVEFDLDNDKRVVQADLIGTKGVAKQKGDTIKRSLIRHEPDKIAQTLKDLIFDKK